jgi:peptidyl-prolyl cis-trans isomerase D
LHLIQALETRGGAIRAFDDVKAELEEELRTAAGRKQFQSLSEQFVDLVFTQSKSLQPAADKLGLQIEKATVARQPAIGSVGIWTSPKMLEAVFSAETIRGGNNTEAVETAPNQLVSARIVQHRPSAPPALAEVREAVRLELVKERAAALAKAAGEKRLQEAGDAGLGDAKWVSRAQSEGLPREVLEAVLRADVSKLPSMIGQAVGQDGYWVLQVKATDKPKEGVMSGNDAARMVAQNWLQAEGEAYVTVLKRGAKAVVNAKAPSKAASNP